MKCLANLDYPIEKIKLTEALLQSIATHMSNKKSETRKTIRVAIATYDNTNLVCRDYNSAFGHVDNSIFLETNVKFRSHKYRSNRTMSPAIQHIVLEHFADYDIYAGCANGNQLQIKYHSLVPGIYEYRCSSTGKYRKWFKVG